MTCTVCGAGMVRRVAGVRRPYRYTFSGLQNVFLYGIVVHECRACRSESPVIPKIGELHRVIADVLTRRPGRLSGPEIRFLRKNMGISARELAGILGMAPETLSRAENGRKSLGSAADRFMRVLARDATGRESRSQRILLLASLAEQGKAYASPEPLTYRLRLVRGSGWKAAA